MGNTYTNSSSGKQNIAIGKHAVAEQTNTYYNAPQAPAEDLLKLLAEIKARLPELPEEARGDVQYEVGKAQTQMEKNPQDKEKIAARLNNAAEIVEALPRTVTAAVTVISLIKQALKTVGL